MPDELPDRLQGLIHQAHEERMALGAERKACHEAAQELKEAVRLAQEEMRKVAREEARKALARQLARIVEGLRAAGG